MTPSDELINRLRAVIVRALNMPGLKPEAIDPDAPLIGEGLGMDSVDMLELVVELEKEFGLVEEELDFGREVFGSVRTLARFLLEHAPERAGGAARAAGG